MELTLIIGGARSGKSDLAQRLAQASGRRVVVVATMEPRDDEMRERIGAHRASRPPDWTTIEAPSGIAAALEPALRDGDFVLLDCVTLWASNVLLRHAPPDASAVSDAAGAAGAELSLEIDALMSLADRFEGELALVTNEVGMGVVPEWPLGRVFRDVLGAMNARLARESRRMLMVQAGLVLDLKSLGALPIEQFVAARP